jgi:PAS domain S-box-containing protein
LNKFEKVSSVFLEADNYTTFKEAVAIAVYELIGAEIEVFVHLKAEMEQNASKETPFYIESGDPIFYLDGKTYLAVKYQGETLAYIGFNKTVFGEGELSILRGIGNIASFPLYKIRSKLTDPRYRELVENSADFIYRCNFKGQFLFMNSKGQSKTGYAHHEYYGMYFYEMVREDYRTAVIDFYGQQFQNRQKESYFEFPIISKTGQEYWIGQMVSMHVEDNRVVDLEAIARDITTQKKTEEDLRLAKTQLEDSIKDKEQFISIMSHEIRTPLNAVVGMSNLLLLSPYYPEQLEYLNGLKISSENLLNILNNILDLAKVGSGNISIESSPVYLNEILTKIKQLFQFKASEKNLDFQTEIDSAIPEVLMGDTVKLNQILINLVSNAIKFTESGSVKAGINLIEEKDEELLLEIKVQDTGIGIAEEKLEAIFKSFTQEDSSITQKYGGTGLGLTITKSLVEVLGGDIHVESVKGEGTTFSFQISLSKNQGYVSETNSENLEELEGLKALIVEDDEISQKVATRYLENKGVKVDVASNGKQALDKLENGQFDFVLMDIQMPIMNGIEAARIFKKMNSQIPLIALTASTNLLPLEKALFAAFITKPFDLKNFYKIIQMTLQHIPTVVLPDTIEEDVVSERVTNLSYLKEASGGNMEFVSQMVVIFLKQTPEFLLKLKEAGSTQDWPEFRKIMHKIKPTIVMMGIKKLEPIVKELEICSKELKSIENLPILLRQMERYCELAYVELNEELTL